MPAHEALIYGLTAGLNAATLHTFDPLITRAMATVLSRGWFERPLDAFNRGFSLGLCGPLGSKPSSSSSSSSGRRAAYGSGWSYAWLKSLKRLGSLQDLHLDMPLVLPGQVGFVCCVFVFAFCGSGFCCMSGFGRVLAGVGQVIATGCGSGN
jgi:hypothetical protein